MQAFDRPTVGCCPSAPAPVRIRGGQSSIWRPLWSCENGVDRFAKEASVQSKITELGNFQSGSTVFGIPG